MIQGMQRESEGTRKLRVTSCVLGVALLGWVGCAGGAAEPANAPGESPDAYEDVPGSSDPGASDESGQPAASDSAAGTSETGRNDLAAAEPAQSSATASPSTGGAAPAADPNGETRTTEVIANFVKERREKVRPCYDTVQREQRQLKGDLMIRFVLDPSGKVTKIQYDRAASTIDSDKIAECVMTEMKTWQFPASSKRMASEVGYPFNFNPRR